MILRPAAGLAQPPGGGALDVLRHAISAEEHARWFAGAVADTRRRYWVIETDGTPVGTASLYGSPWSRAGLWAYYLAEASTRARIGAFVEYWVIERC